MSVNSLTPTNTYDYIQLRQSSSFRSTFSVQNALQACNGGTYGDGDSTDRRYLTLYDEGCNSDCPTACQDPNQLFANPHTLHNCLVLVALAALGPGPSQTRQNGSYVGDGATYDTAQEFSIDLADPDFLSLASHVSDIIQSCFQQYCDTSPYCPPSSISNCYNSQGNICGSVVAPLNADIGGIGVSKPPHSMVTCVRLTLVRFLSPTGCKAALPSRPLSY